tara:strand:+ start:12628 stop:13890 length:1263 start_codon:yes stop_codon:yes gene_type:complete
MKIIKKIFKNFFLISFIFLYFVKNTFSNNYENNLSILKRLPTSIFATVNGEAISIFDLIQRSNLFSVSAKIPIDENFETKILPELISSYIDEIIQTQEIQKENITVPEGQVNQMIEAIEKENGFEKGRLKDFLKENKTDIKILEKQLNSNIGWKQLIANKFRKQVVIQDSEIDLLHKNLKSNVGKEEFFIEQIFLSFENKKKPEVLNKINNIYKQIQNGGDFTSISKQFSESYGGKIGLIGWAPETQLDSKILNDIKLLDINKVSKPLLGEEGYFIVKIKNKRIIGEEIISKVSLFRLQLLDQKKEVNSLLKNIKDCNELDEFTTKYGTADSGSLGTLNYNELPSNLRTEIKKLKKNELSQPIKFGNEEYQIMICEIDKVKPIVPSKFKIQEILVNKKLDTIARQFMSELRSKAVIDIRI